MPEALAEQARLVKDYRNVGGHDDNVAIGPEDVPLLRGFVESLLSYLYWGPASLERGRQALQDRIDTSRATTQRPPLKALRSIGQPEAKARSGGTR